MERNEWKEKDILGNEKYMPRTFDLREKNGQTELSKKENELFYRDFGYKNIDELVFAFDNTKTDEEFDELFDNMIKMLNTLTKLVKIVSNKTEEERINNVIVDFALDQIAFDKNGSDSDSKQDSFDSEFSATEGSGLKILAPNQMLSRLTITLAQLKAGNNSEKLKNEIRQLLYSLYRSKKLTKQLYKSLINII